METPEIIIYTDGSSRGNPGPGGYGIIIEKNNSNYFKEFSQGFRLTTNNRMELLAVIEALKASLSHLSFLRLLLCPLIQKKLTLCFL